MACRCSSVCATTSSLAPPGRSAPRRPVPPARGEAARLHGALASKHEERQHLRRRRCEREYACVSTSTGLPGAALTCRSARHSAPVNPVGKSLENTVAGAQGTTVAARRYTVHAPPPHHHRCRHACYARPQTRGAMLARNATTPDTRTLPQATHSATKSWHTLPAPRTRYNSPCTEPRHQSRGTRHGSHAHAMTVMYTP